MLAALIITSCGGDEDFSSDDRVIGSWYGTRAYNNPVSGTKYQYLTVRFEEDGHGELEYEAPTTYSFAKFTYSVIGNTVRCSGASANSDGDFTGDFEMTLTINGDRLIPTDMYNYFILTRDDSVMTDGNGNEVFDHSDKLNKVWIRSDGKSVLDIDGDEYTEYLLLDCDENIYYYKKTGAFFYDAMRRTVNFHGTEYDIHIADETMNISGKSGSFTFQAGSWSDIPSNGANAGTAARLKMLTCAAYWYQQSPSITISFRNNEVSYMQTHTNVQGSIGRPTLSAKGTFSIQGDVMTCYFDDISWDGYGNASSWFPGWEIGGSTIKKYTIHRLTIENLTFVDEKGSTMSLDSRIWSNGSLLSNN